MSNPVPPAAERPKRPRPSPSNLRFAIAVASAAAMVAVALSGCIGGAQATSGYLYVKDAPTDELSAVHVTFTQAEVYSLDTNWTMIFDGERTVELMSLNASDARELLGEFEIAAGSYEQLRITISDVNVTDNNGTSFDLVVLGNMVTAAQHFQVMGESFSILVDFGLDQGIDLENRTYTPFVAAIQTSDQDTDGDGTNDVEDTDDDGDGIEDALDDDRDGDNVTDAPPQEHHFNDHALGGLCNAYRHGGLGQHGNGTSRPWQYLMDRADGDNETVEDFCEDRKPGRHGAHHDRDDRDDDDRRGRGHDENKTRGRPDHAGRDRDGDDGNETYGNQTDANATGADGQRGRSGSHGPPDGDSGDNATADSRRPGSQGPDGHGKGRSDR